ncbi:MAG: ATP-binding protein, partial [Candidatus Dormibacteraeota bacterium]|nr:ATP-binding protein [Candidatus Dormibacteraeota bacterium]
RLLARLRPSEALSLQPMLRAAGSPDEPGREWVAHRFQLGSGADLTQGRRVVRASFEDEGLNVDVDRVRQGLSELPEPRRTWLLLGDWGVQTVRAEADPERPSEPPASVCDGVERPRVHIGTSDRDGKEVWFDPFQPGAELPNPHMLIDGESGNGKTETVKLLAAGMMEHQVRPLIIDPKDDFLGWAEEQGIHVIDPAAGHLLPFNPLVPVVDHHTGQVDTLRHLYLVGDLVMRVWGLGDQQVARLREAMKTAYSDHGVPVGRFRPNGGAYPTFGELREHLDPEDTARTRLSPLFDLDPFAADEGSFAEMLEGGAVVRLTQLPGSEFKTAMAEFLLLALYDHLVRQGHKRGLRRLVVMDEGWRLAMCPFLEPLLREGRAYGLGVVLASQYPDDMPSAVKGATHTQIHFGQGQAGQATAVRREVLGDARGRQAQQLEELVRSLPTFHAVLRNRQHSPWQEVRVTPYFERRGGS